MTRRLGDAPVEPEYIEKMNDVAHFLDRFFNDHARGKDRKIGFVLLVFPFGEEEGRCNYISNGADREDCRGDAQGADQAVRGPAGNGGARMTQAQRIREEIMALENTVPTDGFKAYIDRQLQIANLRHRLSCLLARKEDPERGP